MYNTQTKKEYRPEPLRITVSGCRELGRRLKRFRESQGMSLRAAAVFLDERTGGGLNFTSIGDIERGARRPDTDTLLLFAQAGYGGMSFTEMVDIATENRLVSCESAISYKCEPVSA